MNREMRVQKSLKIAKGHKMSTVGRMYGYRVFFDLRVLPSVLKMPKKLCIAVLKQPLKTDDDILNHSK